jgi:hypothetical protein
VFSLCDAGVDDLLDGDFLDAARGLYFFAVFADGVCDDCFRAIFVLCDLLLGEGDGVVVFFFCPVGAAAGGEVSDSWGMRKSAPLTLLVVTYLR